MSLTVGRLAIHVPGSDRELGARLGQLVAERLAPPLALSGGQSAFDRLEVEVAAAPGEGVESLAARIAAQIGRAIGEHVEEAGR
jgi:hypothetical protein